jgi:hypothetical protein
MNWSFGSVPAFIFGEVWQYLSPQLTLSLKSIKAALANPVDPIRIGSARRKQTISKT